MTLFLTVFRRLLCYNVCEDTPITMRIWRGNFVEFRAFFLTSLTTVLVTLAEEGKTETSNYSPCHTGKMFGWFLYPPQPSKYLSIVLHAPVFLIRF